jgi:hypothetical protein
MYCIEQLTLVVAPYVLAPPMPPEKPATEQAPHVTQPADERPRGVSVINPNDQARWLALSDTALRHVPTEQDVAEMEALARKEQAIIERRIRRTVEKVKRQSKSKQ